jgi:P27 family predicted phage terminase small subunit
MNKKDSMAPPRKSIEQLKATGNYRPSRQGKRTEAAGQSADKITIVTPKTYDAITKREFLRVSTYLRKLGILTDMDLTSLFDAFNIFAENQRVYTVLKKTDVSDDKYRDLYTMYSTGVKTFNQIIKQFGAVPAERTKVSDLGTKEKPKNKTILDALK